MKIPIFISFLQKIREVSTICKKKQHPKNNRQQHIFPARQLVDFHHVTKIYNYSKISPNQ